MKLRVVALILVIPLLLIFTTSSVTKTVDILVDVPVKSVKIADIAEKSVDIATEQGVAIAASVQPSNATNSTIILSDEATKGKEDNKASVVIKDGVVYPLTAGNVTIKAAAGEKFDTVDLYFFSSKPMNGDMSVKEAVVTLKEGANFSAMSNFDLKSDAVDKVEYSVDDESVASINANFGTITALAPGKTKVTAKYDGIEVKEDGLIENESFEQSFELEVAIDKEKNPDGVTLGANEETQFVDVKNDQLLSTFYFWFDDTHKFGDFVLDFDKEIIESATPTLVSDGKVKVDVVYKTAAKTKGGCIVAIKKDGNVLKEHKIAFDENFHPGDDPSEISLSYITKDFVIVQSSTSSYRPYATIVDENGKEIDSKKYYAVFKSDNEDLLLTKYTAGCTVIGKEEGEVRVSVTLLRKSDNVQVAFLNTTIKVIKPYKNLHIQSEKMTVHTNHSSLDGTVAIGEYSYSANTLGKYNSLDAGLVPVDGTYSNNTTGFDSDKVVWSSTDESIAKYENGRLVLGENGGEVMLTVKNDVTTEIAEYDNCVASITIFVVKDGVNVSTEKQLTDTWKDGTKAAVLTKDIRIAEFVDKDIDDTSKLEEVINKAKSYLKTMRTTGEGAYFVNNGIEDKATVNYLFEITTSLYGNGYSIDADALTRQLDKKGGSPLFRGPLDLVRYAESGTQNASVKAQDNIVFLVKNNGITISNVELKGCSDESILDKEGKSIDLTLLDRVGTVLEVVGDDCTISYSRINNGRTVVRIYGKAYQKNATITADNADSYRVNATINNSILSYGREFILKIGTNFTKKMPFDSHGLNYLSGEYNASRDAYLYDEASPFLTKADGSKYLPDAIANATDEYFYDNYVLTDVTVENSVFRNAGLFSVGLESTFGGLCLHGFDYNSNYLFGKKTSYTSPTGRTGIGWAGVAGTSYPAALRLKGDVRFYDWKQLSSVNSDTLIEGSEQLLSAIGLNMDISKLIETFAKGANSDIVSVFDVDKQKYVNGAIALYGGGKNYSFVDISQTNGSDIDAKNKKFESLHSYSVPVSCFMENGRTVLINFTAGVEPFRFYLYNANSTLGVGKQQADLADGSAYSWLMK